MFLISATRIKCLPEGKKDLQIPKCTTNIQAILLRKKAPHDIFKVGHTSTSVSLAAGLAKARDLRGGKENIIALIGDGSLSGGEAYEGLNNAAVLGSNIIILVNDNDMSIAENQGGLYQNLKDLRDSNGKSECNFFKSLGFDYYYIDEGNNIEKLIETFKKVKDINHPVVVHMHTIKGHGLAVAEENKEAFHWILPGTLDNKPSSPVEATEDYNTITTDFILEKAKSDNSIVAITPATPGAYGFTHEFREKLGKQYTDVGIAEEHAVAYASAACKKRSQAYTCNIKFICTKNLRSDVTGFVFKQLSNYNACPLGRNFKRRCNTPGFI